MTRRAESIDRQMHPLFQAGDGGSIPTSALQLFVEAIDPAFAASLNRQWHSVLPDVDLCTCKGKTVSFSTSHLGTIYAVAIWSDPVAPSQDDGLTIELRRTAVSSDAPRFTASRMLAVMARLIAEKFPEAKRLISYQATSIHAGTIYKASGWTKANFSKFSKWGTRRRRVRAAGFIVAPSTRKPPQITSDKIRWEKAINEIDVESLDVEVRGMRPKVEAQEPDRPDGDIEVDGLDDSLPGVHPGKVPEDARPVMRCGGTGSDDAQEATA